MKLMSARVVRSIVLGVGVLAIGPVLAGCSGAAGEDHSYTDGQYAALGQYSSPGGPQGINVAVQIKNDSVAWIMVTPSTVLGEAGEFQARFAQAVPGEIIGKDIDQISVSRLAGSSLTSTAFNEALSQIKTEAVEP
jgi:hypothetical protein